MRHYDEIVIGHSLSAVAYAYLNDTALINNNSEFSPFLFDFFEPDVDLNCFELEPLVYDMYTNLVGKKTVGHPKQDLWHRLLFTLSLRGSLPFSGKAVTIRIDPDEHIVKIITSGHAVVEYSFQKMMIFEDNNIVGISPDEPLEPINFKVLDWFDVKTGCCHKYDYILGDEDLAREIYFYASPRFSARNHNYKDLVAISCLSREELLDVEYSDVAVRFKVLQAMKSLGIRGARNGRDQKNPARYKYYAVRIEAAERQVYPVKRHKYTDTGNIIFNTKTVEEIIIDHSTKENQCYKTLSQLISK
jgi:hypothetical protein